MKRRSFLWGAGTLALTQLMVSCGGSQGSALRVRSLRNSLPAQLLNEFRNSLTQRVALDITPDPQLKDLFTRLQTWHKPPETQGKWGLDLPFVSSKTPVIADLVTLGDYWLAPAIEQGLIQPIDSTQLTGWKQIPARWQELVTRNQQGQLDKKGEVWGAPYRWGSTVIVYRRDKFKSLGLKEPTDWEDLWREELRDRVSLLDQPREVIGLTLKHLGHSYNTQDLDKISGLKDSLQQLNQQVKFYSSDTYLQPLLLGDTLLAVGWSTDVLPLVRNDPNIAAVIPQSGTALWADLWVRPAAASANALLEEWIDFCWQLKPASEISLYSRAASPIFAEKNSAELPESLRTNPVLLPNVQVLKNSEFLYPLPQSTLLAYRSLWDGLQRRT